MQDFKIRFPAGYQVNDIFNDNLDLNVIFPDNSVFFGTSFTVNNIQHLMEKGPNNYFWAVDMFIVKDLEKITIKKAIQDAINDEYFNLIFSQIGSLSTVYGKSVNYDSIVDECS
ncbi:hypothetical protein SAMN05421820_101657 [Pedobacter steynii]|uniref:Uncharacterized protein n=1 Tax=Pedobacter steynii TaxID=430522 RepID=A0A1G9KSR9_9SPHI|nr:hypothetical protein [Pedobacter steynii]NQX38626.1 hypothetical protein [Pedobacter steynii]SDL52325.1 hypothetical protein SAMN05421820_101657 [Pedobacter steynii]